MHHSYDGQMTNLSDAGQGSTSRFAPSPTGRLHLGHAYSATLAERSARAGGGRFLLRIEDIDRGRSRPEHIEQLLDDLTWLGVKWDEQPLLQSGRRDAHDAALDRLRTLGLVYRCVCTRADIAAMASAPHGDLPPIYPGTCREREVPDEVPHAWRLDMARALALAGTLSWFDECFGAVEARPELFGDLVIARKDAGTSYHLAAVVDDAYQGVELVVRGRDLFDATHVHRLLQALLGLPAPRYHHHPLILGPDGRRLAKRTPGATLADLRAAGISGGELRQSLESGRLPVGFRFTNP